jgi:PBP1b-binding outer membrane lipoprotein LpoB
MKIFFLFIALIISSCSATKISDFTKYQKQFIGKTDFLPTQEAMEGKSPKIVVFALDENENQTAKQAQLGNAIANNIENVLSKNRLAELVDRKAAEKLQKEISLAEMNKTGSYKGPKVAEYAISGAISNADFINKYSSGSTYVDPKTLNVITIPPKFTYSSSVSGNLKIYELPSLTVVESIEFAGKKSRSENVQQKGGLSLGGLQIGGEQTRGNDRDDGLVRKAGEDAIDEIKVAIKNALAKKGYILEKRSYENKSIFKITLGSLDGIHQGDKLEVIGQYETENAISGKSEIERRIITTGKISDQIDPKTSWIIIDDKEKINSIRLGDAIKMKYEKSSFDSIAKLAKNMIEQ